MKVRAGLMLLAVQVVVIASAVGCGDDDSSSSAAADGQADGVAVTTSSSSKADFVKQATAICSRERQKMLDKMRRYVGENGSGGQPETAVVAKAIKAILLPTVETEIAGIQKLGAPAGEEETVEELLAAQQAAIDAAKQARPQTTYGLETYFADATQELKSYGLEACAKGE